MHLRKLKKEDAPLMLEWMHDDNVTENLAANFAKKTLKDCENFIASSENIENDLHLAIASDEDEYMGTVSLKHIDKIKKEAEFAITVRKAAMGNGYSWFGMKEIIKIAFEKMGLVRVYWCVSTDNERACRFYDKHNFIQTENISKEILLRYKETNNLRWYAVSN